MLFSTLFIVSALPHFSFRRLICMQDSLWTLCRPSCPSFWGRSVVPEPLIEVFCPCIILSTVSGFCTYCLLLWVVLRNEWLSRDKKNSLNMPLFSLLFVYSRYMYRCFNLLLSLIKCILFVHNKRKLRIIACGLIKPSFPK